MERNKSLELMVGFFVLIGLVILSYFIMRISDLESEPRYTLRIIFGFISGVTEGAPLRYCGVDAGEVKSVRVFFDPKENKPKVEVVVRIRKDLRVQEDAHAYVATLGLLGEKYIEILPGSPDARILKDGEVLVGHDPLPVEWMAQRGEEIITKLGKTIDSLNVIIGDKQNQARFKQTMAGLEELIENLNHLSADLSLLVNQNKERIGETIESIKTVSQNLDITLESINNILTRLKAGEGTLGKLLLDDKIYNDLEELVSDIKRHPWKLLFKTREREQKKKEENQQKPPYKTKIRFP